MEQTTRATGEGPARLAPEAEEKLTAQDYTPRPKIDGVRVLELPRFVEDGGSLMEIARMEAGRPKDMPGFEVRQITFSEVQPGVIKAWHVHRLQDDLWFIPPGQRLIVGLWDVRDDSPSQGVTQRIVMGDGRAQLLFIPRGVAHGASNPYTHPAYMLYLLSEQFSAEDTDELRLPWDSRGEAFWQPTNG
ncbi:MAG: dTDP-4-dehydrorhamnose 3,5-epimerase family protein [Euryarchaeota archaeon]|nr:dTDP-4-dehydrorhamnose 3,5-epimerase family protein [Euryarchaeota archaeon]